MLILKTSPIVDNQTSVTPSFDRAHITTNADPSLPQTSDLPSHHHLIR
jgi:hypothetical protein